jgi:hypothetical protein
MQLLSDQTTVESSTNSETDLFLPSPLSTTLLCLRDFWKLINLIDLKNLAGGFNPWFPRGASPSLKPLEILPFTFDEFDDFESVNPFALLARDFQEKPYT